MKLTFIVIYLGFIVSAKKHHRYSLSLESDEHLPFSDGVLDLRGGIRREFALEAALMDHARSMICSPLSVLMPLGKLAIGAEKKTEQELLDGLGLYSSKQIEPAFKQLRTSLEYMPGVTLDMVSRIYVSTKNSINKKFAKRTKHIFKSTCQKIRPTDPVKTANTINSWVAENTRNKIKKLISSRDITEDTSLIIVNAIYFAGTWLNKFDKTFTGDFFSPSGRQRLPMMSRTGKYPYWRSDTLNAQLIEIPYEGGQSSMIIVLPYSNNGLGVLLRALKVAPELLNKSLAKMKPTEVTLSMPKFKIESELDLSDILKKIGLRTMFDKRHSGLSGMIDDETVFVTKAKHKAIIEVNEKGTEAAAATGVVFTPLSALIPIDVKVNQPFLFFVRAYQEQLFAGVYNGNSN